MSVFEDLGGVPAVVLADRMGCLKGGVAANLVIPTPDYVRFATHHRFRPDFCNGADLESKGIVANLVGYAKDDLMNPLELVEDLWAGGYAGLNERARQWGVEVNKARHSGICAIPTHRLASEREHLSKLPSLRMEFGPAPISRKVDKLCCIRFASARYSVPNTLIGQTVTVLVDERDRTLQVISPLTGQIHTDHALVAPGETSILDAHYTRPRPDTPTRAPRARTAAEKQFLALGPAADAFLTGAAAAGVTKLGTEITEILTPAAAHGESAVVAALQRAAQFGRWRAGDIHSILATNGHAPRPTPPGQGLVLSLPAVPTRSLDAYRITPDGGETA